MRFSSLLKKIEASFVAGLMLASSGYIPVNAVTFPEVATNSTTKSSNKNEYGNMSAEYSATNLSFPVSKAPSKEDISNQLPQELQTGSKNIKVARWETDNYDPSTPGEYSFTPIVENNDEDEESLPRQIVEITKDQVSSISTMIAMHSYSIENAPTKKETEDNLPSSLEAVVNGNTEEINVLGYSGNYDPNMEGEYYLTPEIDTDQYELTDGAVLPDAEIQITDDKISTYADPGNKVVAISQLEAQFASGAEKEKDGLYIWKTVSSAAGHAFKYRINYAFSVQGSVPEGEIRLTMPAHILKNKDGEYADNIIFSIPEKDSLDGITDEEKDSLNGFAYYLEDEDNDGEDDTAVVYNYRAFDEAPQGYFEVSYATTEPSFSYMDYDANGSISDAFFVSCEASGLTAETKSSKVAINTSAYIESVSHPVPMVAGDWVSQWGEKPSDADQYQYFSWEFNTTVNKDVTQKYYMQVQDTVSCEEFPVEVIGVLFHENGTAYTLGDVNEGIWGTGSDGKKLELTAGGKRSDYLLMRYKKKDAALATHYNIKSTVTVTLHPVDGVDEDTTKSAERTYGWTSPVFEKPTGHFYIHKYGNENWTSLNGYIQPEWKYASYSLQQFQEGSGSDNTIDSIKYSVWQDGYAYPWTVKNGGSSDNPLDYGYQKVTYTAEDDTLYPLDIGSSAFTSGTYDADSDDAKNNTPLSPDDYDFEHISIGYSFSDAPRNENGEIAEGKSTDEGSSQKYGYFTDQKRFNIQNKEAGTSDVVMLYTKSGNGDYVKAGAINLGTGSTSITSSGGIDSITKTKSPDVQTDEKWYVAFKSGVDGWKYSTSNNYYHTNLYTKAYVKIFDTERTKAWTGSGNSMYAEKDPGTAKDAVLLKNVVTGHAYDNSGDEIFSLSQIIGDRIRRSEKSSYIQKSIAGASNNTVKQQYSITWKVQANETLRSGASNQEEYSWQNGGTFYDLLPQGTTLSADSVSVSVPEENNPNTTAQIADTQKQLGENEYEVSTIENYKNSDRTMLIVRVKTEAPYYTVLYDTIYEWDAIKDYGRNLLNPVAYETGNDTIANGYPDNGGVTYDDNGSVKEQALSDQNTKWYSDLDPETDDERFIYSEARYDVEAVTAAVSGLNKRVMAKNDSSWVYTATVSPGEIYRYRLRFMNSYTANAKDMVLYDSLENYGVTDGAEKGTSEWHGTLQAVDVSQPKSKGILPVVYISTKAALRLDDVENRDLTNTEIWQKVTDKTDLSKAAAIAVDLRSQESGKDYILPAGESVTVGLYMKAPETGVSSTEKKYPETWNNVYISNTQTDIEGVENAKFIHQDYTTVRYAITSGFGVHKYNANNKDESIPNVQFTLSGTSDYGTKVNITSSTDKDGLVSFKNIEKGAYTLKETSAPNDWLVDTTMHKVVISDDAQVTIDGKVYVSKGVNNLLEVADSPRVHNQISFTKLKYPAKGSKNDLPIQGVKFRLQGTSYYGSDVMLYAESAENGQVTFEDVERGNYELSEVSVPNGYLRNPQKYAVTIDENGNLSIDGATKKKDGSFVIYNDVPHSFRLIKKNATDGQTLSGAKFTLTGTSEYGTAVNLVKTTSTTGFATFLNLEPGIYVLRETAAPAGYVLDSTARKVTISHDGTVAIDGLAQNNYGNFEVLNQEAEKQKIVVTKKWIGKNPEFTENNLPTLHISAAKPEIKSGDATLKNNGQNSIFALISDKQISFAPYSAADSGSITKDTLPDGAVKIDDGTTNKSVYAWDSTGNGDIVWWSDAENVYLPEDSSYLFIDKKGTLVTLDLSGLDSSRVTKMDETFSASNGKLRHLDLSGLDTSNVTSMSGLCYGQSSLKEIEFGNFQTGNVTNMSGMFTSCYQLSALDLSSFDTSKVTNMSSMFSGTGTQNLKIDFSNFDTSSVKTMGSMFADSGMTDIDLTGFDYSNVQNMESMFQGCRYLQKLDLGDSETSALQGSLAYMFQNCSALTDLDIHALRTKNVTKMSNMFYYVSVLKSLDLSNFETSNVTDMYDMFYHMEKVESLDVSSFDTSKVTSMAYMFGYCNKLQNLDVSNFDVSNVTSVYSMFDSDYSLQTLDISGLNFSKLSSFSTDMFSGTGRDSKCLAIYANNMKIPCYSSGIFNNTYAVKIIAKNMVLGAQGQNVTFLNNNNTVREIDISGMDLEATSAQNFISNLWGDAVTLHLDGITAPNLQNAYSMFSFINTDTLDLSSADMPNVVNAYGMFTRSKARTIDISGLDTAKIQYMDSMFSGNESLATIYVSDKWSTASVKSSSSMFSGSTLLPGYDSAKVDASMANYEGGYLTLKKSTVKQMLQLVSAKISTFMSGADTQAASTGKAVTTGGATTAGGSVGKNDAYGRYTAGNLNGKAYAVLYQNKGLLSIQRTSKTYNIGDIWSENGSTTAALGQGIVIQTDLDSKSGTMSGCMLTNNNMSYAKSVTTIDFEGDVRPTSLLGWFANLSNLTSIQNMNKHLDTSRCQNMRGAFYNCASLKSIDTSGFYTTNVTNISQMFYGCTSLEVFTPKIFEMQSVTECTQMFAGCTNILRVAISSHSQTTNLQSMAKMFQNCSSLVQVNLSSFDTKAADATDAFSGCTSLVMIAVSAKVAMTDKWGLPDIDTNEQIRGSFYKNTWSNSSVKAVSYTKEQMYAATQATGGAAGMWVRDGAQAKAYSVLCGTTLYLIKTPNSLSSGDSYTFTYNGTSYTGTVLQTDLEGTEHNNGAAYLAGYDTNKAATITQCIVVNTIKPITLKSWFEGFTKLTTITGINEKVDTSATTNFQAAFRDCPSLTGLDISSWNTSKVNYMMNMFSNDAALTSLDLSGWNVANIQSAYQMFNGCTGLTTLNIKGWKLSNVITAEGMFAGCSGLTSLDVSTLDLSKCTNIGGIFNGDTALTALDVSTWKTGNITAMGYVFNNCKALKTLNLSNWDTHSATNMTCLFNSCEALKSVDVSHFDTSNVTDMSHMFNTTRSLKKVDLSSFNTSKVTNMCAMFANDDALEEVDCSSFDTSNVTNMYAMFCYLPACKKIDVSSFNTAKVTTMWGMFSNDSQVEVLDVSGFNTANVTNMQYMFNNCQKLKRLDTSGWGNTSKVTNFGGFITNAYALTDIDVSGLSFDAMTNKDTFWSGLKSLESITFGQNFRFVNSAAIPSIAATAGYTGNWTLADPYNHTDAMSADKLTSSYSATETTPSGESYVGIWIWEKEGDDPSKPKGYYSSLTNIYVAADHMTTTVDSDGNETTVVKEGESADELFPDGYWQKLSDDTWTYTFPATAENQNWYLWEDKYSGYQTDHDINNPLAVTQENRNSLSIANTNREQPQETGSLILTKKVVNADGTAATDDRTFTFAVTLTKKDGSALSGVSLYGDVVFSDGKAVLSVANGKSVTMSGIPAGYQYSVEENEAAGYTGTIDHSRGNITGNGTVTVLCTNTRQKQQDPVSLTLAKKVIGHYQTLPQFTFDVMLSGLDANTTYQMSDGTSFQSDAVGEADVPVKLTKDQSIQIKGIPVGAQYAVTEQGGDYISSYIIRDSAEKGKIRCSDGSNETKNTALATAVETADEGEQVTVAFTNRVEKTQDISVSKKVVNQNGNDMEDQYSYTMRAEFSGMTTGDTISSSVGKITADESGNASMNFQIRKDEKVIFQGVPVGTKYKFTEEANDKTASYTVVDSAGNTGKIVSSSGTNTQPNKGLATAEETVDEGEKISVVFQNKGTQTASLIVKKLDSVTHKPLGNAEYALYRSDDTFVTKISIEPSGESVKIDGLSEGSYYLVETKAPAGHTISGDKTSFKITKEMLTKTIYVTVEDGQLVSLPVTGGEGRQKLVYSSIVLFIICILLIYRRNRKQKM